MHLPEIYCWLSYGVATQQVWCGSLSYTFIYKPQRTVYRCKYDKLPWSSARISCLGWYSSPANPSQPVLSISSLLGLHMRVPRFNDNGHYETKHPNLIVRGSSPKKGISCIGPDLKAIGCQMVDLLNTVEYVQPALGLGVLRNGVQVKLLF